MLNIILLIICFIGFVTFLTLFLLKGQKSYKSMAIYCFVFMAIFGILVFLRWRYDPSNIMYFNSGK